MTHVSRAALPLLYCISLAWAVHAGKDFNWDQFNYHLYTADLLWRSRWQQDYFAASVQSYLNGVSYLPFYAMVRLGLPDWLISLLLATAHFANVVLVWKLLDALLPAAIAHRTALRLVGSAHALATPIFLLTLGGSFNDPVGSALVIGAVYLVVAGPLQRGARAALAIGALLGLAAGIKLTNGVFAPAIAVVMLLHERAARPAPRQALAQLLAFGSGGALGFLALHGFWSARLWQEFGNPFFPFFNGVFRAPDYLPVNLHDTRFLGEGLIGIALLPWKMLRSETWVYNEAAAPDLRVAALLLVVLAAAPLALWRWRAATPARSPALRSSLAFVALAYLLWALSSRIGRYAMPIWLLCGPLAVALAARTWHRRPDAVLLGASLALAAQVYLNYQNDVTRWTSVPYAGRWHDLTLPAEVTQQPAVFIGTATQTLSFLSLYLHPGSGLASIAGQHTQPVGDRMRPRLAQLLRHPRKFLVLNGSLPEADAPKLRPQAHLLAPYGLRVAGACLTGKLRMDRGGVGKGGPDNDSRFTFFHFCPLSDLDAAAHANALAAVAQFDPLFERVERQCPRQFDPPGLQSVLTGPGNTVRSYFNSGTALYTENKGVYAGAMRTLAPRLLGDAQALLAGAAFDCPPPVVFRYLH